MLRAMAAMTRLPRAVWLLGVVSLLNDVASEAIYPLLPFFLTTILGATAVSLGLIEGTAEAVNAALKVVSGRLSDRWPRRRPIVFAGYALSAAARPFIAAAAAWPAVLMLRFLDRVGKGVRGAPRDAMLADLADRSFRGRVFGFHRAMDHTGAVAGPLLATAFLWWFPGEYRLLFALTAIPGAATVLLLFKVREPQRTAASPVGRIDSTGTRTAAPSPSVPLPAPVKRYLVVLALFTLGNSADAFLLLRLTDAAGGPTWIPLLWSLLHLVKMGASLAGGAASDRFGRRPLIAAGWLVYGAVYTGFALSTTFEALVAWFLIYGIYYGCVEGTERALMADFAHVSQRGTVFGVYNAVAGIGAFVSSVVFGAIWTAYGSAAAFGTGAALALAAALLLFLIVPPPSREIIHA